MLCVSCSGTKPKQYGVRVVNTYAHDTHSYTQGLFFKDGEFFESTGQFGESTFRKVDLATGAALRKLDFSEEYFLEGSVIFEDKLYMLTWMNKVAFVYNPRTFEFEQAYSYPREGWGLTTDGQQLIASDGSSRLYFLDKDLKLQKTVTVKMNGRPLRLLNELEWINGDIWANVYTSDMIVIINPRNGEVKAKIDCTGLLPDRLRTKDTDVLNGIAYNPEDGKIYITGKNWPELYEIELVKKK